MGFRPFARFSEGGQRLFFDRGDLLADLERASERSSALTRRIEDRVDAIEDVAELGLHFEHRPRAELARVPAAQRIIAELAALEQQLLHLVFVAAHELTECGADLRALGGIAPEHVLEEEEIL